MKPARPKVLLADENSAALETVSTWLEEAGYEVRRVGDGRRALAAAESDCPDFLLAGRLTPPEDASQLCRAVRGLCLSRYVYILVLASPDSLEEMVRAFEAGTDDFLAGPLRRKELLARMRAGARVLELERRLSEMARTDALTGLVTKRTFYAALHKEWSRSQRARLPLSCVMMDIDFFKRVNDLHGHPAGDAVLQAVAHMLEKNSRASDTVCRYGGEEFCVMLPETREDDAAIWAERVRSRLAELVIPVGDKKLRVTGSFGVAERQEDTQTPEQLVDRADQALLCAKQSGRDRVVRYESVSSSNKVDIQGSDKLGDLFEGITALHVMTPMVVCLRENQSVGQAAEFFLRSRITSTPVVDEEGKLSGFLSEKDVMAAMVSLECWHRPIREVMKPNVICYEEETPIRMIYEFLCRVSVRRVVIVKDGRPTGTISRGTLLRWFRNCVLTSGLMELTDGEPREDDLDPCHTKQRLAETAHELAQQASGLYHRFQEDVEDFMPHVVGGATRMQELVNDLLAYSRYANQSATGMGALHSLMLSSGHTD